MDPRNTPYDPPKSNLEGVGSVGSGTIKMFSPIQARVGAGLGGPFAAIYILNRNFVAMGNEDLARKTIVFGLLFSAAIIGILPFLPEKFPGFTMTLLYIFATSMVMKDRQPEKDEITKSDKYTFQSNWAVFLVSIVGMVAIMALAITWVYFIQG